MKKSMLTKIALLVAPVVIFGCSLTPRVTAYEQYDPNKSMQNEVYVDSTKLKLQGEIFYKNFSEKIDSTYKILK